MADTLPIDEVIPDIQRVLVSDTRLVLAAPPGAGKTTRVPLALLDASWRGDGRILMLEPRRLAARTAAERLAHNLDEPVGRSVGYRIRGDSKVSRSTRIEVITEGILTRMIQADPDLPGIAAILFDEVHERSIHSDLGLALALEVQDALRDDLRLLAMSATVDVTTFARLMRDCPVIESQGRIYPIETHRLDRPWQDKGSGISRRAAFCRAATNLVLRAIAEAEGDVLVFLPGVGEIRDVETALKGAATDCGVTALYGAMTLTQKRAALSPDPESLRRIVLATSIAETSLTVPGVRVVVDCGHARRPHTDPATGMGRLETVPVSVAEADQRRGRAGRLGPGTCYRMWTKGQEGALDRYPMPEIHTADITALALELAQWGVDDPSELAFLDPPRPSALTAARGLLGNLGALDASGRITAHGRALVREPLHPRLGHLMLRAREAGLQAEGALIAAVLSARPGQLQREMPGGDLRVQFERCASGPTSPAVHSIRDEARRIGGKGKPRPCRLAAAAPGLVALAYPDRVALRRSGDQPRFILSNGRGAAMDVTHGLAHERLVVATDLEDGREARIRAAIPIAEGVLRETFPDALAWVKRAEWSPRHRRVEARRREMLGAIALKDEIWRDAPPEQIGAALADGIRDLGLQTLNWTAAAMRFRRRVAWANEVADEAVFPDLSDAALTETMETWLVPHLAGMRTVEATSKLNLTDLVRAHLDWADLQALEKIAPEHFVTPAGARRPVDYASEKPRVAVRIQEMYGTAQHPRLGKPPVPILFDLLSPADRPVQTTADLPAFWSGSYSDVRKDLRIRYPKHDWPENPAISAPMLRSRKQTPPKDTKN
ncbi:MAG: ATP-dependent helicase HrpB [Pseudomonadota bacterium]